MPSEGNHMLFKLANNCCNFLTPHKLPPLTSNPFVESQSYTKQE